MIDERHPITLAARSDAAAIACLSRDEIEFGLGWRWTEGRVLRAMADRETNVVVARDGAALRGFGIMQYSVDSANLQLLAVGPRYRRQRVATRIVCWLEAVAATAGIGQLSVQLRANNGSALALYERLGYVRVDRVRGYYGGREEALVMAKYLHDALAAD